MLPTKLSLAIFRIVVQSMIYMSYLHILKIDNCNALLSYLQTIPPRQNRNMIHNIIHISDIHIRSGDSNKSRYDEYIHVFNNLYDSISQQPSILNKSAIIVITGDIFHDKNKIGPSGIKIATYLLHKLSMLAHIIIIRGNHDYRQDHPTEPDMISALMSCDIPNVTYLDTTGIHSYKNVSFGIVAIQETLLYGSTSGVSGDLPAFPIPSTTDSSYKIALFHGTINGTTLQNGSRTTSNGYPIDWFQGYDAILLGDVHLQQINRASIIDSPACPLPHTTICQTYTYNKQVPWGYSGSLLQQDFGETIKGHGYALWNLRDKIISVYHIKNSVGMIKLNFNGCVDDIEVEHKQYIKPISKTASLKKIIQTKWFPDSLHIRVSGENVTHEDLRIITKTIQDYGKTVLSITKKSLTKVLRELGSCTQDITDSDATSILNINSSDSLVHYIHTLTTQNKHTLHSDKWKQWLINPDTLIIPIDSIPDKIASKLTSKTVNVRKAIDKFTEEFDKIKTQHILTGKLTLHTLEWNWILNYKNGNIFDFDANTHCISVLNAKNGNGKSNFLEIICIALFGKGFPSRYTKNYTSNIICDKKPDGVLASTLITFTLNDQKYALERTMRNHSIIRSIKFEDVVLYRLIDETKQIIHQKSVAVDRWVSNNIGESDIYLMSAMLSQNADNDFFSLDNADQKKFLDRILSLDHIIALQKLLKESATYYKTCSDLIESYCEGISSSTTVVDQKYVDELDTHQTELDELSLTKNVLYAKWHTVPEKSLSDIKHVSDLQESISILQRNIQSLPSDNHSDLKLQILQLATSKQSLNSELSSFHSFSDIDLTLDTNIHTPLATLLHDHTRAKKDITCLDLLLRLHPYYKKKDYGIYERMSIIQSNIKPEFENSDDIDSLVSSIRTFETWNTLQLEKFSQDKFYFENNSEITNIQQTLQSCTSIIQETPGQIYCLGKQLDKLRRLFTKLSKDKDTCSDKRPNRPTKTKEWLLTTQQYILTLDTLDTLVHNQDFLRNSIQRIPIVCTMIHAATHKLTEYNKYIADCSELPFNPHCDACRQQPWRTKYDSISKDLPTLNNQLTELESELSTLKYPACADNILHGSYSSYLQKLNSILSQTSQHISDISLYNTETTSWTKWDAWTNEYETIKTQCDSVSNQIHTIESQKRHLDLTLEKARLDAQRLQTRLDYIQSRKQDYSNYCSELSARRTEYDLAKNKLTWSWYTTLYMYRLAVYSHTLHLRNEIQNTTAKINELEKKLNKCLERERYLSELDEKLKILNAYPYWLQWTSLQSSERALTLKITELQTIIKSGSYNNSSNDDKLTKYIETLQHIKDDYDDISYIAAAFDGYREWLYKDYIAPVILSRVNSVLELICNERPLFLECDWLDAIDTLSWFVRDGTSRVIIQKASGFQRFIVGIAMRVAINQIGLSRIRFSELFIDEGFTTCDSDNLELVPEFLRGLLRLYGSIYLATHLDDLKGCADKQIHIRRDDTGLSLIQHGNSSLIKEVESKVAITSKKRGRPPKNSVNVTLVR